MSCSEVKKIVLRTLAVALVLVMPWAGALATDVSDWAGIVNAYNGWQSTEFTLMEDVAADSVIEVPSWHAITITLNDHTLTPPDGYDSAFSGEKAVTYVVDDAAEFANAAADPGSSTIRLAGDITLTDSIVLKNAQTIDAGPYTLTLDAGVEIGAEVSTYDEFKRAMNNAAVSVVRLTKNIEAGGWDTYSNISKIDANGFSLTGDARLTFDVSTQDELALALAQPATNKVVQQSNIRLTRKVEVAGLGKVDLNNHNLIRAANGGLVVGVWQEYDITNAMAADYVYGVKLYDDITLNSQVNVDSLDQVDENGYTLSFSGNGKIALNVSNEQELRAALANPDIKYINMTNDIRLQRELVIGSNTAHVITNGYKLTGAKVRCNVDSWEALRSACALGLPGAEITLTRNITAGEGSLNITADTVIDLHNYNITTGTETIFNVQGGKLTVKDTTRQQYPFGGSGRSYTTGDASKICNESSISSGNLIYYVTHSDPAAANGYANAGTTETLRRYSVSLNAVGLIDARKSTSPIFRVHSGAELEVSGGAYFGSKNRAIYSEGDVYLVGDTVFAGNSTTTESERDGGAIYIRNGELHLGNYESSMSHGVVVTGNHVEDGCSGGGIYIHESAVMNMEDGYITNNWCGTSTDDGGWSGGGGIAVLGVLKMSEGQVTANRAVGGGGIKTMINTDWNEGGNLLMTGGYVAANVATTYEGGGITINHSGYGKITGGYITNNETQTRQHWGGGGIFISDYGYMEMEAVFVVDNEAGGYGGGIAGCSTGRIDTHDPSDNLAHSAAIFENFAAGQHMSGTESTKDIDRIYAFTDPVFNRENGAHYQDYFCTLSSYICGGMLGNGTADWSGTIDGEPIYQGTIKKTDVIVGVSITGLTSHPTKQDKNNALRAARVYISGNESYTHGGGVLCNGYLVIGHDDRHATIGDRMSVSGWKEAEGFSLKANEFGFYLVQDMNGNREPDELYFTDLDAERYGRPFMTTATNDADGLVDFAHRIPFSEEGTFYYLVGEMKGNTAGVTYDDTIYLITVTVERDVLTVVETPDGGKHDIIAEPKTVYFYRIDKVELAKKESGANTSVDLVDLFTFVNTKMVVEYVDIEVTKKWVDSDNQDGIRPEEITVQLLADGEVVEGKTATLTGTGNEWTYTFEDLPKHVAGTKTEITYTIEEIGEVVGYTTAYSADTLTITNTHETDETEITVTKKWVDNDNQDGLRPEKITVQLLADGVEVEGKTAELTGEGNEWTYTFTNLPKMADGKEIVYTVKEIGEIVGYTTAYSADTLTITNTHETDETEITVTKKWVDNGNQDGLRPEKITVQLLADGVEVEGKTAELTGEGNEWTYTFTNLPKMADGEEIVYTVEEIGEVVGYTTAYSADTLTITNTHETETVSLSVEKVWDDSDNIAGLRSKSITVQLMADGQPVAGQTITLNKDNSWKGGWTELDKFAAGKTIAYSVEEVTVPNGYTSKVEMIENIPGHFQVKITNTYSVDKTQITVTKKWVDGNNYDGIRPRSIIVQLVADGVPVEGKTAVMTGVGNEWTLTFSDLPKYAEGKEGQLIQYTVKELGEIVGYTTAYSDDTLTITNTHELFKRYVLEVEKVDAANLDKKLAGAKFTVYADAACTEELGVITTGADGKGQMGNLLAGAYYLVETTVPAGYQLDSTVHEVVLGADDAKTVTVKLVNHALIGSLTLKKTVVGSTSSNWNFDFDIELTIDTGDKLAGAYNATLNGMATTVVFTETDNGAKATVTLKDGDTLTILGLRTGTEYTVTEQPGEFFTTTVNGEATNKASGEIAENAVSVVAFQNKLELTDFSVKKEWHGLDAGENTPEISLTLYCNGEVYTTVTPKPTVGGLYIYENLPTMVNGVKAVYSVVEQPVDGFTTTYINAGDNEAETDCAYNGGTIINSKIPQTGDNAHLLLWMGMLMLAAIGLIGMVERIRRSEL